MDRRPLVLALLVALSAAASAREAKPDVAAAVREAFGRLDVEPGAVRVSDVDFWERWSSRLVEAGRMMGEARRPGAEDRLRPALVGAALRRPLDAVSIGLGFARGDFPEELRPILGRWDTEASASGEDPIPKEARVPPGVRLLAARLAHLEDALVEALGGTGLPEALPDWVLGGPDATEVPAARAAFDALGEADLDPLRRLALRLVGRTAKLREELRWVGDRPLRVETERGLVVVGSPNDDVHEEDAWLLVDPGGDDVYRNNAGGTAGTFRTALCVDLEGDDRYESETPFVQGSALGGVGLLVDDRGNDVYRGGNFCQGAALCGVALLVDGSGDDRFDAKEFAQGAAAFGLALLANGSGDDEYALDRFGQGLGRTAGTGLLHDRSGSDRYVAKQTHKAMYSQWTGGRDVHWSWAQGCGFGFYGRFEQDLPDGGRGLVIHDLFPGGVGVLLDEAGDDVYEGSMYAQGTAYFYGLGICADLAGDDRYTATWYGQGAAPHFACGILVDAAGDDAYTGMNQVQGNGRDFSTAVFLDLAGDDTYVAEDRAQGCGDLRDGYGIFVDAAGDDRYDAKTRTARGWTTSVKPDQQPTDDKPYADWGVFLDLGGTDVYAGKAKGADGTTWVQKSTGRGIGIDR